MSAIQIRDDLESAYRDVYTPEVMTALAALSGFNEDQKMVMVKRMVRRAERAQSKHYITFLDANGYIPRTNIKVQEAREGRLLESPNLGSKQSPPHTRGLI